MRFDFIVSFVLLQCSTASEANDGAINNYILFTSICTVLEESIFVAFEIVGSLIFPGSFYARLVQAELLT